MISPTTCPLCPLLLGLPAQYPVPAQPGAAARPSPAGMGDRGHAAAPPGSPACYLEVVLWVPVRIKDDAGVSSGQVDAQPACPRAQEKDEAIRVRLAEAVNGSLAQVPAHPPVDALIGVPAPRGEEAGAASQRGLNWLQLTNPFVPLPCTVCGAAGTYWQDLRTGGGSGHNGLCALWLFPKLIPLMMAKSSRPHARCMDMGLTGTRPKGRACFHLVTPRTSPGQCRKDRSELPSFGVSAPTSSSL